MAVTPKETFNAATERSRHLLSLYDILTDCRKKDIRSDWKASFLKFMRWPAKEKIVRIDGKGKASLLILRESVGLTRSQFAHEYVSELLRASVTATISALDRYIHDEIVCNAVKLLGRPEAEIPTELKKLRLPSLTVKRSLEKLRSNASAKPGIILKKDLQDMLHRDETFQSVSGVEKGSRILGIKDFWNEMARNLSGYSKAGEVQDALRKITARRNQIVHEADVMIQEKARTIKLREITRDEAENALNYICDFVDQFEILVQNNC